MSFTMRCAGAAVGAAAAAIASLAVAPAHADVTGNGLTITGSTFQVGQDYKLTGSGVGNGVLTTVYDTVDGVTVTKTETSYGSQLDWTPLVPGTHQIYIAGQAPSGTGLPAAAAGPITVDVTGTVAGPPTAQVCDEFTNCVTVQGTPEVGCTMTLTPVIKDWGVALFGEPVLTLSAVEGSAAQSETYTATDNGSTIATVHADSGPITVKWTPATAGVHDIGNSADTQTPKTWQSPQPGAGLPGTSGSAVADNVLAWVGIPVGGVYNTPLDIGDMYVQVAPAGTTPCA